MSASLKTAIALMFTLYMVMFLSTWLLDKLPIATAAKRAVKDTGMMAALTVAVVVSFVAAWFVMGAFSD